MPSHEEVLDADEIQGNVLAGFSKDYQRFLFIRMPRDSAGLAPVRAWLRRIARQVSSLSEVRRFNALFRAMSARVGEDPPGMIATWLNVAFSASAIEALTSTSD